MYSTHRSSYQIDHFGTPRKQFPLTPQAQYIQKLESDLDAYRDHRPSASSASLLRERLFHQLQLWEDEARDCVASLREKAAHFGLYEDFGADLSQLEALLRTGTATLIRGVRALHDTATQAVRARVDCETRLRAEEDRRTEAEQAVGDYEQQLRTQTQTPYAARRAPAYATPSRGFPNAAVAERPAVRASVPPELEAYRPYQGRPSERSGMQGGLPGARAQPPPYSPDNDIVAPGEEVMPQYRSDRFAVSTEEQLPSEAADGGFQYQVPREYGSAHAYDNQPAAFAAPQEGIRAAEEIRSRVAAPQSLAPTFAQPYAPAAGSYVPRAGVVPSPRPASPSVRAPPVSSVPTITVAAASPALAPARGPATGLSTATAERAARPLSPSAGSRRPASPLSSSVAVRAIHSLRCELVSSEEALAVAEMRAATLESELRAKGFVPPPPSPLRSSKFSALDSRSFPR